MIKVTKGKACQLFSDELLPRICLQLAGGGYTAAQTAKAMLLQNSVQSEGKGKIGKVLVEKIDETD